MTPRSSGQRRYSEEYGTRILAEYETLDKQGNGALLRLRAGRSPSLADPPSVGPQELRELLSRRSRA
ncbi:hypothetical protein ACWDE9_47615, partial [Streptomyces olivaceoviridis]